MVSICLDLQEAELLVREHVGVEHGVEERDGDAARHDNMTAVANSTSSDVKLAEKRVPALAANPSPSRNAMTLTTA